MTSASLRRLLVAIVVATGCGKSEPEAAPPAAAASPAKPVAKPPRAAPAADVAYDGSLSFRYAVPSDLDTDREQITGKEGRLSLQVVRDKLEVAFQNLPVGTSLRVGQRAKVVVPDAKDANGRATEIHDSGTLVIDGADLVARARNESGARYRRADFATKLDESITIEMPRYQPILVKYSQDIPVRDVKGILRRVVDGPVRLSAESDAELARKSAGILIDVRGEYSQQGDDFLTKFGVALTDIRFVALVTAEKPQAVIKCGGFKKPVAGSTAVMEGNYTLEIQLLSQTYAIYDRLDGKKLAESTFRANAACPDTSMTSDDSNRGSTLVPDRAAVARWVTREAAKRN